MGFAELRDDFKRLEKSSYLVSHSINNVAFVAIKIGRRQDGCQLRQPKAPPVERASLARPW